MQTKKAPGGRIPRVHPSEMYPQVGDSADKLKALIPVFGEGIIKAVADAVASGQVRHGELSFISHVDPMQTLLVVFDNPVGNQDLSIQLSGNWRETADIPLDTPLFSPAKGIVYRKRQRQDEMPIAEEGKIIEAGGAICAISQTKSNIWYLELPPDKFPKGGILTKFVIPDGKEVEIEEIICYIKKVE